MSQTSLQPRSPARRDGPRVHRAWWVAATTGLVILVSGWSTGLPDVLTNPLRQEFGWSRGTIGFAFAVNIMLYGLTAPFAAALMDRVGIQRVVAGALTIMAAGAALTTLMTASWQLVVGWGLLVGLGTGSLALTFAATVTNRWFVARRGMVSGVLTSASMFGGMALLPLLAWLVTNFGWRSSVVAVGLSALALVPLVCLVLRDHPGNLGMKAYGAAEFTPAPPRAEGAGRHALLVLGEAIRTRPFLLLIGTFGVCGASTNGIMMTHFLPAAHDNGMPITVAAALLAGMGVFNVVGATASGWLTDRASAPWLLTAYYALRGVSLVLLPLFMAPTVQVSMVVFVVVYGLLDLATVPPTIALCREFYGNSKGTVVFGWVSAAHALGAAAAAFLGGVFRGLVGSYTPVWIGAGVLCGVAALLALALRRSRSASAADV
ncbi:MFS transporter [Streptomonospora wellingtoniae]|uniref:MFS transporter n=1 Tax=Streptomonospora wellingtoniae TaxID=3075544 RepID=A0ABU2KVY6_9ACTN|nr:MFS transporter [Streptomonospora sp. DSM 45055]MDT0303466.1 MFS transporter [Streptomonospora sp. DSM 45055]